MKLTASLRVFALLACGTASLPAATVIGINFNNNDAAGGQNAECRDFAPDP